VLKEHFKNLNEVDDLKRVSLIRSEEGQAKGNYITFNIRVNDERPKEVVFKWKNNDLEIESISN